MKKLIFTVLPIVISLVAVLVGSAIASEKYNKKPVPLENKVDSVLSYLKENAEQVDTFDIYLKNIKELGVVGTNTLIIYDDPDAGFDNELMQVVSPEAGKLIFNNMGKDIDSRLIVIGGEGLPKVTLLPNK